jgi:hypothetical protein
MPQRLSSAQQVELAAFANQAPSVHNTQPARWHFADDGAIWILSDRSRHLEIGDPSQRDAGLSCDDPRTFARRHLGSACRHDLG